MIPFGPAAGAVAAQLDREAAQRKKLRKLRGKVVTPPRDLAAQMMADEFPLNGICEGQVEPGVVLTNGNVVPAEGQKQVVKAGPVVWP